eukprot:Hpha_TRINITY_DN33441_c0_g1::TRINITY_DN33441_c0_g1_i1::g.741::m.741
MEYHTRESNGKSPQRVVMGEWPVIHRPCGARRRHGPFREPAVPSGAEAMRGDTRRRQRQEKEAGQALRKVERMGNFANCQMPRGCATALSEFEEWLRKAYAGKVARAIAAVWETQPTVQLGIQPDLETIAEVLSSVHALSGAWPASEALRLESAAVCAAREVSARAFARYLCESRMHRGQLAESWPLQTLGRCPRGHDLRATRAGEAPGRTGRAVHRCAKCGSALTAAFATCVACRHDMCLKCAPGANPEPPQLVCLQLPDGVSASSLATVAADALDPWGYNCRVAAVHHHSLPLLDFTSVAPAAKGSPLRKWCCSSFHTLTAHPEHWVAVAEGFERHLRARGEEDVADELCSALLAPCTDGLDVTESGRLADLWASLRGDGMNADVAGFVALLYTCEAADLDRLLGFDHAPKAWRHGAAGEWNNYEREFGKNRNVALWQSADTLAGKVAAAASAPEREAALRDLAQDCGHIITILTAAASPIQQPLWRGVTGLSNKELERMALYRPGTSLVWVAPAACSTVRQDWLSEEPVVEFWIHHAHGFRPPRTIYPDENLVLLPALSELWVDRVFRQGNHVVVSCTFAGFHLLSSSIELAGVGALRAARRLDTIFSHPGGAVLRLQVAPSGGDVKAQPCLVERALVSAANDSRLPGARRGWRLAAHKILCGAQELIGHESSGRRAGWGEEEAGRCALMPEMETVGRTLLMGWELQTGVTLAWTPGAGIITEEEERERSVVQQEVGRMLCACTVEAAEGGRPFDVQQLASHGHHDPHLHAEGLRTALHSATANNAFWREDGLAAVRLLAQCQGALESRDAEGRKPLHTAAAAGAPASILQA